MWLHCMGDVKKVAACKVKPYEFMERKILDSDNNLENHVMLEDRLRDVKTVDFGKEDLQRCI